MLENIWQSISTAVTDSFPLINIFVVVIAGCLGFLLYGRVKSPAREILLRALGLLTILMGAVEIWNGFFVLQTAQFETTGTLLVVIALPVGLAFGYALTLERSIGKSGVWLFRQFVKDKPSRAEVIARAKGQENVKRRKTPEPSAEGYMLASVLCAFSSTTVFSMLSYASAEDPLPLLIRLGFHFIVFFLLAALFGSNVILAAVPLLVVEGLLLVANRLAGDLITNTLMNQLRLIGAVILVAAGVAMGGGKRVRAAQLIPAYFIPVIYGLTIVLATRFMESA